ncbi:MAG: TonB-dependent receptor domain-containing protein [Luminiphilus sp.]
MARKNLALRAAVSMVVASACHNASAQAVGETFQEVVVTGSRIPVDPNLGSSTPVQSLNESDFRLSGEINLAEVVNDIPALVSSLTAENSFSGANELNLRGLGGERTLTLVNGRRHVAGFRGTQAVDIGSIPRGLVERVEVTTGGASAIYGADAVTGVVNFILRDDFTGFKIDARGGVSGQGDAETYSIDALYGLNFAEGRGNVVLALSLEEDSSITHGERRWSRNNGISVTQTNPDYLSDPNAPPRAVIDDARFWLTSQEGSIAPSFGGRGTTYVDINGNGIADCQESEGGRVGFLAGCWLTNPDGSVRVNQDGIVLNGLWGIGGDGGHWAYFDGDTLYPETDRYVANLNASFELSDSSRLFFEGKYVKAESRRFDEQDSFYDTLFILPSNPFIPTQLLPVIEQTGYLLLTQDPLDWSDNNPWTYTRETMRFVGGVEFEPIDGHVVEMAANFGRFTNTSETTSIYLDRVFSAINAVRAPDGSIVCASDLDPNAFYEIDYFAGANGYANGDFFSNRYYSFTPGDGQCKPLNPFGTFSASKEAQDFVTAYLEDKLVMEQFVVSATIAGQFDAMSGFLAGPIGYAAGIEYRDESSDNRLDPLTLGVLPQGTSLTPGVLANTIDPWLNSFISIDNTQQFNTKGGYDVADVFVEFRVPVLSGLTFAEELTLDAAVRVADYSTVGETTSWKFGGTWAPIQGLNFRATISEAVRAPNISELFDPKLPIFISATADPCDLSNVNTGPEPGVRQDNCVAALQASGVPTTDILDASGNYVWFNPLTGRFAGVSGGNPDLKVETAETFTVGLVFTPSFIDGLAITLDYWDVTIDDAIAAVGSGDILSGCLDSNDYPNVPFCDLFTRRADGGLDFLETGQINYAKLEASGIDFAFNYSMAVGESRFGARLVGSYQEKLDRFFNPTDLTEVDPEVGELQLPEWSASMNLSWDRGPLSLGLQVGYQSRQAVDEIQDIKERYGADAFFDEVYILDLYANYQLSDSLSVYGGVNNLTDEEPFSTELAWPVGPRGRFFFLGVTYSP